MPQDDGPQGSSLLAAVALGAQVVDSIMGDLTGEGRDDALLVIALSPTASAETRPTLEVAMMQRDAGGRLRKVASNTRLLTCGPDSASSTYIRAERGAFTIVDPGGPGSTGAEYRFIYDGQRREWLADSVQRQGEILTATAFGRIDFARFDPQNLRHERP